MHDVDLSQRLHFAESDFLTALENGTMLASYHETWSALLHILRMASKVGSIGSETLHLAHIVASRVAILANCSLNIKRLEESSAAQLQSDWDIILHQMASLDLNANPKSLQSEIGNGTHRSPSRSTTPATNAAAPSLLAPASQWLLNNLHNPYPTAEVKAQIATTSSCQVSSISSWFANARRRIGWTTLYRESFFNCRAGMIDAAYRALVEEDPQRPLSLELRHSFVAMRVAAEDLYSSTFARSAFAGDLDTIDMAERDRDSVEVQKRSQDKRASSIAATQDSYSSPDRCITVSPPPTLGDSLTNVGEEDVVPPTLAGSKRCWSSMEPVNQQPSAVRLVKRLRTSMTLLPSPSPSTDGVDLSSGGGSPELSPAPSAQPDVAAIGASKRPCDSMVVSRLHTVPDLLPRSNAQNEHSIDDWFNTNFDTLFAIPPPVDTTEPDSTANWEVELFKDYSIPGNPRCAPAATEETHIPAQVDFSEFDTLLQSIGGNIFVASPDSMPPFDISGASYTTCVDPSIPDFSQTNTDWSSLLNGPDQYQPTVHSIFPSPQHSADSQPLSGTDLSMLRYPINSKVNLTSKQVKLDQLHAMQEAVRRMEQELQSEGIVM